MELNTNVIELLKDNSFPSVTLIDGCWGSGKTHYINNELEGALKHEFKNHKVHYLSLYGISNIDDFRDKLISLTLTKNSDSSKLTYMFSELIESVGKFSGEKGIGGIINGISGAVKYKFYSQLDEVILLLDDLERIPEDKTIKDILGECLNLAETKNIKVIVIANEQKLTCKDDIEKVINDKVKFSYNCDEIASILKDQFTYLSTDYLYHELVSQINSTQSTNIRVLKRALIRFKKLKEKIESCTTVSLEVVLPKYLRQILNICYAKFEAGFTAIEMKGSIAQSFSRFMEKDESSKTPEDKRLEKLDKLFGEGIDHEYLIDFCCDGVYLFDDIIAELRIPVEGTPLEKILDYSLRHKMTDEEFELGITELITSINKRQELDVNKWYHACDAYIYLVDSKYISSDRLSKHHLLSLCEDIDTTSFNSTKTVSYPLGGNFQNHAILKLYNTKVSAIENHSKSKVISEFNARFFSSWQDVKEEAWGNLRNVPFIQNMSINDFIEAIKNWPSSDIIDFRMYLRGKYHFSNINDYYVPELNSIRSALPELDKLISELQPGLRLGAIADLKYILTDIEARMTESIQSTNTG
jgi:hypothetical protein